MARVKHFHLIETLSSFGFLFTILSSRYLSFTPWLQISFKNELIHSLTPLIIVSERVHYNSLLITVLLHFFCYLIIHSLLRVTFKHVNQIQLRFKMNGFSYIRIKSKLFTLSFKCIRIWLCLAFSPHLLLRSLSFSTLQGVRSFLVFGTCQPGSH